MIRIVFMFFICITLLFLFLFIYKDKPRIYYSIMLALVLLFAGGGSWIYLSQIQKDDLIPVEDVSIENLTYETSSHERIITAMVVNNSTDYMLTSITLRIDLTECSDDDPPLCLVVDNSEAIIPARIEPGAARNITWVFYFNPGIHKQDHQVQPVITGTMALKHF